jgi:hypothetical protein
LHGVSTQRIGAHKNLAGPIDGKVGDMTAGIDIETETRFIV